MTSRAFGMIFAVVVGTPLFAAGVLAYLPPALAMGFCLGVAAAGVLGAIAGAAQISAALPAKRSATTDLDSSLDAETREALLRLNDKISAKDTP